MVDLIHPWIAIHGDHLTSLLQMYMTVNGNLNRRGVMGKIQIMTMFHEVLIFDSHDIICI